MRLFAEVDGIVDSRDAGWLLMPPFRHDRRDIPGEPAGGVTYQMILSSVGVWLETNVGVPENLRVRTASVPEDERRELLHCLIVEFENGAYRPGAEPGLIGCQCEVICYGYSTSDPGRTGRLADRVLTALQGKTVPLFDYRDEAVPLLGYMKFREGEVIDRTSDYRSELGSVQRVCVVRVPGIAERL